MVDPDRAAFQQVATTKLPRARLPDSDGKSLWLDQEYSSGTRRGLGRAVRFYLVKGPAS
jgi:hypothetical protein